MWRWMAVALLVGGACSGGSSASTADCGEVYVDGRVLTEEDLNSVCLDGGEAFVSAIASLDCVDGRTLSWNAKAWWFDGEGLNLYSGGGAQTAPTDVMDDCIGL